MKIKYLLFFLPVASGLSALAQTTDHLTVTPAVVHPGQTVSISYNPAGTKLEKQTEINVVAYFFNKKRAFYAEDVKMTKEGGLWKSKITLADTIVLAGLKISSEKLSDDNNEKGYIIPVVAADGKPVQGELLAEGYVAQGVMSLRKADLKLTQALMEQEFAAYPESAKGLQSSYYGVLTANKQTEKAAAFKKQMLADFNQPNATEAELTSLSGAFYSTRPVYDSLSKVIIARYPQGIAAMSLAAGPIYKETDPAKKVELYNAIKTTMPFSPAHVDNIMVSIAMAYNTKKEYDNFTKYADMVKDKRNLASVYNSVAWPLAEAGTDLELAAGLSKQSLDIVESYKTNPPAYFVQYPPSQRVEMIKSTYASDADTYALILFKQGKVNDALAYQEKAIGYNKGITPDMNERYVTYLAAAGKNKDGLQKAEDFIKSGKSTEKMKETTKTLYTKVKGSETGYASYMSGLEAIAYAKARAEVMAQMLTLKASGFVLKDMDGAEVSLASLKGKVVVVDFWATWCGPCKASFPAMQKMVTKFKANPNVQFVFVDTWETDAKKEELVKKFIADNKYSFHVLYDNEKKGEAGKYEVVDNFGVSGIPTKFVLDKSGNIRFKSVGWIGSDDALINELSIMIDIAGNPPQVSASINEE